jgi:hypothetical protein
MYFIFIAILLPVQTRGITCTSRTKEVCVKLLVIPFLSVARLFFDLAAFARHDPAAANVKAGR